MLINPKHMYVGHHVVIPVNCVNTYKKTYLLIGRIPVLSIHNKLMLYKHSSLCRPTALQLWGCTKQRNNDIIQRFQNKVLRNIIDAPWYIINADLHRDLQMETVTNEIGKFAKQHVERLLHHVNV